MWSYAKQYQWQRRMHCNGYQVAGKGRTCWWFIMGIRYVDIYQAVSEANMELLVVCCLYQVCVVIQSSSMAMTDLLVVYNINQVCGVIPSCSMGNEGRADGL